MFDKINLICHMYFLNDILLSIIRVSNSSIHGPGRFFFGNTENYLFSCLCYLEYHKINDFSLRNNAYEFIVTKKHLFFLN